MNINVTPQEYGVITKLRKLAHQQRLEIVKKIRAGEEIEYDINLNIRETIDKSFALSE